MGKAGVYVVAMNKSFSSNFCLFCHAGAGKPTRAWSETAGALGCRSGGEQGMHSLRRELYRGCGESWRLSRHPYFSNPPLEATQTFLIICFHASAQSGGFHSANVVQPSPPPKNPHPISFGKDTDLFSFLFFPGMGVGRFRFGCSPSIVVS